MHLSLSVNTFDIDRFGDLVLGGGESTTTMLSQAERKKEKLLDCSNGSFKIS